MKILKIIGLTIVALIVIALLVALVVPNDITVTREVTINKPREVVFEYTRYLKNQDNFSKWMTMDPNMKKSYTGTDGQVGFISRWESENDDVGVGEQEITRIAENERIDVELRFIEPMESKANAYITYESLTADQTKVVWGFEGDFAYPFNLMLLFWDMDELLGADLQYGLDNLKTLMEAMPAPEPEVEMEMMTDDVMSES